MAERLKRFITIIKKRRTPIGIVVLLAAVVAVAAFLWGDKASASDYITAKVERGNVEVTVSATGTVQAVTTVQVGTQVSGTVSWLGADFNSIVRKGQVIARLDASLLEAERAQSEASVTRATAEVDNANVQHADAQQKYARSQELARRQLVAQSDLDAA